MFSTEHIVTVLVTVTAIATLALAARWRPGPWTRVAAGALAGLIVGNELGWLIWVWHDKTFSVQTGLPIFLCDVAAFVSAAALVTRQQLLAEVTYFWGIAGTANGIVSPDIADHFPSYQFLQYFVQHGAIPAASVFLVVGLRIYPRPWAAVRVLGLAAILVVFDALVNLVTGGNYMFLRSVPPGNNLLDLFGPWPWYIAGGVLIAVVFAGVLDAPFRIVALVRGRSKSERYRRRASRPSPLPPPGR